MLMATNEDRPTLQPIASAMSPELFAELSEKALAISATLDGRNAMRNAEVFPDVTPHWHVVTVLPGQERIAADDLSDRCFGVYLPESEHTEIRRGRKVERKRLMLPGYVFVFVWDVDRHMIRIRSCDGVRGMLFLNGSVAVVPDRLVDRIRVEENKRRPLKGLTLTDDAPRKAKRHWRKTRKTELEQRNDRENEVISVHSYSPFIEELRNAEADGEVSAFHKALGLALNVEPESA